MAKINLAAAMTDEEEKEITPGEVVDAEFVLATTLSLAAVKPSFEQYVKEVDVMVGTSAAIVISDEKALQDAVTLGGAAKKIAKLIEAKRKEVTADASYFVDSVNGFCKIFTEKLVANPKKTNVACIEIALKSKITAYQTKIELERRKQEEVARIAAENLQKEINKEAKKAGVEAPQVPVPIIPKQETVTRTESGTTSHQVKTWKCYVDSPEDVPREFCAPDGRLLNNAVKQGIRTIAGCRIVEESETRFRM